jgi:hypothetical protein
MTIDIYAALTEAQAEYDAALARRTRLAAGLNEADALAASAAADADRLLAAVAGGDDDITDDDLMEAREQAKRKAAAAELAKAKFDHGHQQTLPLQLSLLRAKAAVIQSEQDGAIDELIQAAADVDSAVGAVHRALTSYNAAGHRAFVEYTRANAFNNEAAVAAKDNPVIAKATFLGTPPRVIVAPYFGLPKPMVELFEDLDAGKISARRSPISSLAERIRAAFNRLRLAA